MSHTDLHDISKKYLQEGELNSSLGVYRAIAARPKRQNPDSLLYLFRLKAKSLARMICKYPPTLFLNYRGLRALFQLKGAFQKKRVLLLGNGPSQGFLSPAVLQRFKDAGNDLIVVNNWTVNDRLSVVSPTFIVISDPYTLSEDPDVPDAQKEKNRKLKAYLVERKEVKILCPTSRYADLTAQFGERVVPFVDMEARHVFNFISPVLPRTYASMTLYKALSLALWMKYKDIFILGMDNTYPKNLFHGPDGVLYNIEMHAGGSLYRADISTHYKDGIADALVEYSYLFRDLRNFRRKRDDILNLDPYSLTDAFRKNESLKNIETILLKNK